MKRNLTIASIVLFSATALASAWNVVTAYGDTQNDAWTAARKLANWECAPGVVRTPKVSFADVNGGVKATMHFKCHSPNR